MANNDNFVDIIRTIFKFNYLLTLNEVLFTAFPVDFRNERGSYHA